MKDHLKSYLVFFLMSLMALLSICADTLDYPGLDVTWTFNAGNETFAAGFTDRKPAEGLNQGWIDIRNTSQINMRDQIDNSATRHMAKGRVYVYWNFFSNESLEISLGSTGPLTVLDPANSDNNRNMINWKATWTPMTVNANGDIIVAAGPAVSIGRVDNQFTSSNEDYSSKIVFRQNADNYPLKSKYGYTRIDIETQDTKASDIPMDHQKVKGIYTTSLILDVKAR